MSHNQETGVVGRADHLNRDLADHQDKEQAVHLDKGLVDLQDKVMVGSHPEETSEKEHLLMKFNMKKLP